MQFFLHSLFYYRILMHEAVVVVCGLAARGTPNAQNLCTNDVTPIRQRWCDYSSYSKGGAIFLCFSSSKLISLPDLA